MICCMAGCSGSSSSDKDKSSSSTNSSSASESSSKSDSSSDSESSKASSKINAIGYDVKSSERLTDKLKKTFADGYKASMKASTGSGAELTIAVKGGKIYSSNKGTSEHRTMIFSGGSSATVINNTAKSYTEQAVSDAKLFISQNDLLFGQAGDFIKAQIDEQHDLIGEFYKLDKNVTGKNGQMCFQYLGSTGELAQMTITYEGSEDFPIYFRINELTGCDDKQFEIPDLSKFQKK